MGIFKRNRHEEELAHETVELTTEQLEALRTPNLDEVNASLAWLHKAGIDDFVITGGASLTARGMERHADDVDAIVSDETFETIEAALEKLGTLPSGYPVADFSRSGRDTITVLAAEDEDGELGSSLPIEFVRHRRFDATFEDLVDLETDEITLPRTADEPARSIKVLKKHLLQMRKEADAQGVLRSPLERAKDRYDLELFQKDYLNRLSATAQALTEKQED